MPIELPPGTASYSDRSPPPRNRQLLVFVAMAIALVIGFFWALDLLVNGMVWLIPPSVERQLGTLTVPAFEAMSQPSPTQDTLNQLLDRLETHLPAEQRQGRDYQIFYIPDATINAAAIPGDRIIIYDGLLQQTESENELMMVLGHELGHFAHRDHLRGLGRGLVVQLLLAGLFGDVGSLQSIAVSGVASLTNARFSQNQEFEADDFGLDLLYATYGKAAGATDFFGRMSRKEFANVDFLASHPTSRKRVQRLEDTIKNRGYRVGERSPLPPSLKGEN